MKNKILFIIAALTLLFSASINAAPKNIKPFVIPEIREWNGGEGFFAINNKTKIIFPKDNAELVEVADLLASDYSKLTGISLKKGKENAGKGRE